MFRGISDILGLLHALLPPWAVGVAAAVLLAAILPGYFQSIRLKQIRNRIRRMVRADEQLRAELVGEIFELAADRPSRLESVVVEAIKMNQHELRVKAIERLEALGHADLAKPLRQRLQRDKKPTNHPLEHIILIERYIDGELWVAAEERLADALQQFGDDPEILALEARLREARASADEQAS